MTAYLIHQINEAKAKSQAVALISIDQSAFYNLIDHSILLQKLQHLSFNEKAIKIIKNI